MNIICATDNKFVQHCCVMLVSVLTNNRDVTVFLLTEGLTDENQKIIRQEIESKSGILQYICVDSSIIAQFPMPDTDTLKHISPATYYRLLIPDLLPDIHKAIYLDCDIVVRKSLEELWNTDISNYALGAVHQVYDEIVNAHRLGYPVRYGYFNAGVLLINIDYWRKNNIQKILINYLVNNYNTIKYHDQDALNANLYDKNLMLPCKWNMISYFYSTAMSTMVGVYNGKVIADYSEYKRTLVNDRRDPSVIHFVSKPKPWQKYCVHPFANEYFHYSKASLRFKNVERPNLIADYIYTTYHNISSTFTDFLRPIYRKIRGGYNRY